MPDHTPFHPSTIDAIPEAERGAYEEDPDHPGAYRVKGVKRPSDMTAAERSAFLDEYGLDAWKRLLQEHRSSATKDAVLGPFKSREASRAFRNANGLAAWTRKMAEHRARH